MSAATASYQAPLSVLLAGLGHVTAQQERNITGLCLDSRKVRPGDLFFALRGTREHGLAHASQALAAGAAALVWEPSPQHAELPPPLRERLDGVPAFAVNQLRQQVGVIADRFYGSPSDALTVIGVTGTDGKTSCSHFIAASLDGRDGRCGLIGTLGYGLYGALDAASHTTPDAIRVHGLLADMRAQGARYAAMEVSSHALDQHRVEGVRFHTAVLTNLSRDHLDYHGDVSAYSAAKRRLFLMPGLRHAVVNLDDALGRELARSVADSVQVIGYGMQARPSDATVPMVRGERLELNAAGLRLHMDTPWGSASIQSSLLGEFNASNLLAVLATLVVAGLPFEDACAALERLQTVPGRVERFGGDSGKPLVVVDYAHTPQALESVLHALRGHGRHQLWCVFGCGGERDAGKRPLMAAAVQRYADRIVVTDDNPRGEDPERIIAAIMTGFDQPHQVHVERDRARAIAFAIANAAADDIVLVAGKGHEDYQEIQGKRLPFSDRDRVRRELEVRT